MTLERQVANALRADPVRRMNLSVAGTPIYSTGYERVARAIERGRIGVVRLAAGATVIPAFYSFTSGDDYVENTLYLRNDFNFADALKLGLLVHEATHAIQDWHQPRRPDGSPALGIIDSEIAAFTAQAFYYLAAETTWAGEARRARVELGRGPTNPPVDRIIRAAHAPAHRIFTTRGAYRTTAGEERTLRQAILAHDQYHDRAHQIAHFDGF